jgi:hypothetical protein
LELRLASLHTKLTSHLLALGLIPTGAVVGDLVMDFLPHTIDKLGNTRKLGVPSELDWDALRD